MIPTRAGVQSRGTIDWSRQLGLIFTDASQPTVTNADTSEHLIGSGATIPANLMKVGTRVRIKAHAEVTTSAGATTLTAKLKWGTTVLQASAAVDTAVNNMVCFEFEGIVKTAGSSGKLCGYGKYIDPAATTWKVTHSSAGGTAIDTTAAVVVGMSATWSAGGSDNVVTLDVLQVEIN